MRILLSLVLTLVFMGGTAQLSFAQTDSFNVELLYGEDAQPPTTPDPFSVTPIAATQIDVAWGTSTDDTGVIGYQLFRDAVQIATTTLTSYSDSGLIASTTYSYSVTAFDAFGNFSTSSITLATTTFSIPPPPVAATTTADRDGSSATIARLQLTSFVIAPSTNGAKFEFSTNLPTRFILRYGKSSIYDDGTIESPIYKSSHITSLFPLEAGTEYVYELYGYDRFGAEVLLSGGNFTTIALPDTTAPANVANFSATPIGTDTFLRWDNPTEDDFVYVRIVRNHLFYPLNESDGFLVYEGSANSVTDQGGLVTHDGQYYTIFTYDSSGNLSSGAIAYATTQLPSESIIPDTPGSATDDDREEVSTDTSSTTSIQVPPDPNMPQPQDILVSQGGTTYSFASSTITLASEELFFVSIPADKITGAFKTIVVTLDDPRGSGKNFSFLLRLNNTQTEYTATIAPVQVAGGSQLQVDIYDYDVKVVGSYQTQLTFTEARGTSSSTFETLVWRLQTLAWGLLLAVPILTLVALWFIFWRHRKQDEDNQTSV